MLRMRAVPGTTHMKIFQSWFVRVWQGEYCFSLQLFQLNIANADKFDFSAQPTSQCHPPPEAQSTGPGALGPKGEKGEMWPGPQEQGRSHC